MDKSSRIPIVCIVLRENRETARARLMDELSRNVLDIERCDVKMMYVDRDRESGVRGCAMSHCKVLRRWVGEGVKVGLVLEEDCKFTAPFRLGDLVEKHGSPDLTLKNLIVYLGYNVHQAVSARDRDDQLILIRAMMTHAMIILDAPRLLELTLAAGGEAGPIDMVYHQIAQPAVGVWPVLAVQHPGYSSIEDKMVDYVDTIVMRANFFHEIMYPEEVRTVCLDLFPPEVRFKLRRLPLTTVVPELKLSRVILVVDGTGLPEGWAKFYKANRLGAFFQTRSFKVGMFSSRVSAMSREYYSTKSPYLTPDTPEVDLFYPPFESAGEGAGGVPYWIGKRGLRSVPVVMFVCMTVAEEEFVRKLKPHLGGIPLISGPNIKHNQITPHPIPDVIFSFNKHPFAHATVDGDTRVYIIKTDNADSKQIQMEWGIHHLSKQIVGLFELDLVRTHVGLVAKYLWDELVEGNDLKRLGLSIKPIAG